MKEKISVLVIGSGGREHALCYGLRKSDIVGELYCSPGNGGIVEHATCISLGGHHDEILSFCEEKGIDLVVIGPEQPLVEGLSDILRDNGIRVFGCSKEAAQLEGSKGFTKDICRKYNIPTAAYGRFDNAEDAKEYIRDQQEIPIVIKADGLAAGKGVIIAHSLEEAEQTVEEMFAGKFGEASSSIVIEEFLDGEEVSFFALCDGERAVEFGSAQDHKAAYDGDKGPNTGGMGTYSPAPVVTDSVRKRIMDEIIIPTVNAMKAEGIPFSGVLFAGLMVKDGAPKLIEFNVRFGDPEAQVLIARLDDDLGEILYKAASGELPSTSPRFREEAALCVVLASKGYPNSYEKNTEIKNIFNASSLDNVIIFHAGTKLEKSTDRAAPRLLAVGGRVLGVTALGRSVAAAQELAYKAVDMIEWDNGFCRRDIGWRAVGEKKGSSPAEASKKAS